MKIAVMGYGTIGSGVVDVLRINKDKIAQRAGEPVEVKYILDLRDFPGDPMEELIVHDYKTIANDPEIGIVVETMGGVEPAYTFVKEMLEAGKQVATSNKNLVAAKGAELIKIARDHNVNFQFEASVGGGTVFEFNQNLGAFVAVDNRYSALIPMKEIHSRINVGETVEARVANVREDGKLNLSLQKPIREQINNDSEMVYNIIESYGGTLPFNDKADKEVIEKEFGLSKNAFKRAVGHLLKEGKIQITEKNIIIK